MKDWILRRQAVVIAAAAFLLYLVLSFLLLGTGLGADFAYAEAVLARKLAQDASFLLYPSQTGAGVASLLFEWIIYPVAVASSQALPIVIKVLSALFAGLSVGIVAKMLLNPQTTNLPRLAVVIAYALAPPVVFCGITGASCALGLFVATLVVALTLKSDRQDTAIRGFLLWLAGTALVLSRLEAAALLIGIAVLPRSLTGLRRTTLVVASLGAIAMALFIRKLVLGSVFDGVFDSTVGHRGLIYALSLARLDAIELVLSLLVFPFIGIALMLAMAASAPLVSATGLTLLGSKPEQRKAFWAFMISIGVVYGVCTAELGAGEVLRYLAFALPALAVLAGMALEVAVSEQSLTLRFKPLLALGIVILGVLVLTILAHAGFLGEYAVGVAKRFTKELVLFFVFFAGFGLLVVFVKKLPTTSQAWIWIAVLGSGLITAGLLSSPVEYRREFLNLQELTERMRLLVKPEDKVAFSSVGAGLWIRPKRTGDLRGWFFEQTRESYAEKVRKPEDMNLSQLRRILAWEAAFVVCNPEKDCPAAKGNSDFQFAMKTGQWVLLRASRGLAPHLLDRFGPSGTQVEDWFAPPSREP